MTEPLFDIIFRGDIVLGHQIADVKLHLQHLFKVDARKIDALFTGGATPLKRNVNDVNAQKYKLALEKAGAKVEIKAAGATAQAPRSRAKPRPVGRPISQAAEKSAPQPVESSSSELSILPLSAFEPNSKPEVSPVEVPDLGVAPVGESLLQDTERSNVEVRNVDVSALSVREAEGELLDEAERSTVEALEFDLSDLELAQAGEDLLRAEERAVVPEVDINVGGMDLAPAGSDMGQKPSEPPPPAPDTSNISLAE